MSIVDRGEGGIMTIRRPLYYISIAFAAAILVRHYFGAGVAGGMAAGLAILWRMSAGSGRHSWMSVWGGAKSGPASYDPAFF